MNRGTVDGNGKHRCDREQQQLEQHSDLVVLFQPGVELFRQFRIFLLDFPDASAGKIFKRVEHAGNQHIEHNAQRNQNLVDLIHRCGFRTGQEPNILSKL